MSEVGTTQEDAADVFAEFAEAKGDRLAAFHGEETTDDKEVLETTQTPETLVTPAPESTPAAPAAGDPPAPKPAPAAAAPAAAATDIWAKAPAELRAAHEAALASANQKYRSDIGRQAAHQRRIQLLEEELERARGGKKPAAADGSSAPAADPNAPAAPTSLRERPNVKRAIEEYPDVVTPLVEHNEELERRLVAIESDHTLSVEERKQQTYQAQEAALDAAHPDWRVACNSREFAEWKDTQPQSIKDAIKRNGENVVDAEEAIAMVDAFKAHFARTYQPPAPQPAPPALPQPTSLQARRDAQLRAVTKAPASTAAAMPDGPSNDAGDKALFDHFAAKKAGNRK